jgi:hypothetical protein
VVVEDGDKIAGCTHRGDCSQVEEDRFNEVFHWVPNTIQQDKSVIIMNKV